MLTLIANPKKMWQCRLLLAAVNARNRQEVSEGVGGLLGGLPV